MKVNLYLGEAIVRNSQDYAFPSSALSNNKFFVNWIYSNTIQTELHENGRLLYFYNGLSQNPLNYISLIDRQYLKSDTIKELQIDIIEYIRQIISQGYYFTTSVNEFYVPNRRNYQLHNFDHGIMIYGFDDDLQTLQTVGYSNRFQFQTQTMSWGDFRNAFMTTSSNVGCNSFKANSNVYEIDIIWMVTLLEDYLNSYDTRSRFRAEQNVKPNAKYGINACRGIIFSDNILDQRNIYLLYEHKKLMVERLILLEKQFSICNITEDIETYNRLLIQAKLLLMECLKCNIEPDEIIKEKLKVLLKTFLEEDEKATIQLVSKLHRVI